LYTLATTISLAPKNTSISWSEPAGSQPSITATAFPTRDQHFFGSIG
jgi:hypothetical protein